MVVLNSVKVFNPMNLTDLESWAKALARAFNAMNPLNHWSPELVGSLSW